MEDISLPLTRAEQDELKNEPSSEFNGVELCNSVREETEKTHRKLADEVARSNFERKWTEICENDPRTKSLGGADQVAHELVSSLGERFDHYFDATDAESLKSVKAGKEVGIGIEAAVAGAGLNRKSIPHSAIIDKDHPLIIRSVETGGAADRAKIEAGDKIKSINGMDVIGMTRNQAMSQASDRNGAAVELIVSRRMKDGSEGEIELTVRQEETKQDTATYQDLGDGVGYVKLKNFMADEATNQMFFSLGKTSKDEAIILDLRNNGGGKLFAMEQIAQMILGTGEVYYTERRTDAGMEVERKLLKEHTQVVQTIADGTTTESEYQRSAERIVPQDKPIVVLVDEYSASASEILAGALQANNRAIVVGMPTTGKSEGQEITTLPFNRAVALTNFEFFPGGKSIPVDGLKPDIVVARGQGKEDLQLKKAKELALILQRKQN